MTNKTLLYKFEYDNVNKTSIPNFSLEEIGHILLTIEKGIIKTPKEFDPIEMPIFKGKKYDLRQFSVNFRNVMEGTRRDITFLYKLKTAIYDKAYKKIIAYHIDDDIQKLDIVSFFTKIKNSKSEHRIYQIGGRYSKAMEDARIFWGSIKGKPKEEILEITSY